MVYVKSSQHVQYVSSVHCQQFPHMRLWEQIRRLFRPTSFLLQGEDSMFPSLRFVLNRLPQRPFLPVAFKPGILLNLRPFCLFYHFTDTFLRINSQPVLGSFVDYWVYRPVVSYGSLFSFETPESLKKSTVESFHLVIRSNVERRRTHNIHSVVVC